MTSCRCLTTGGGYFQRGSANALPPGVVQAPGIHTQHLQKRVVVRYSLGEDLQQMSHRLAAVLLDDELDHQAALCIRLESQV